jgi:uncharacterized Rmd1/YagE family protein
MSRLCASYCLADSYQIDELARILRSNGLDPRFYDEVIHVEYPQADHTGCAFFFPYGCAVFWGMNAEDVTVLLTTAQPAAVHPVAEVVYDECRYQYTDQSRINEEDDLIDLDGENPVLKLSLSYGLSQSVKLSVFENTIADAIQKSKHLPEELARKGKTSLSRQQLSRKIGVLYAERHSINLHSDLLDTPEFFWRRPDYEAYYHMASDYLDIDMRTNILNQRLSILQELYEILSDELKHLHSSRLEWIIILLIVSEVVLSLLKDVLKWL